MPENVAVNNEIDESKILEGIKKRTNEEELTKYIKDEMSKLRTSSMMVGFKVCRQMVLDICKDDSLGLREKLRKIKKFCQPEVSK